jgi:hypothetical protein
MVVRNQSWPHWKGIAYGMPCSERPQKPTENRQEEKKSAAAAM